MDERERDTPETVAHARSIIAKLDPAAPAKGKRMRTILQLTLALVVLFGLIALSVSIDVANGNANRLKEVPEMLELVSAQVDGEGRALPRNTLVSGSLQSGQSLSYTDPETGKLLDSLEGDSSYSYDHEVRGTVAEYTITATARIGGKDHRFAYDSTTDKISEITSEEPHQ